MRVELPLIPKQTAMSPLGALALDGHRREPKIENKEELSALLLTLSTPPFRPVRTRYSLWHNQSN